MTAPFIYRTEKPKLFAACARFISTEETRYYLKGVKVEPQAAGGVKLIATDGHRMCVAFDETGYASREAIITPPKIKMPPAWFSAKGALFRDGLAYMFKFLALDEPAAARPTAEIAALATDTAVAAEIDGQFPQWSSIAKWYDGQEAATDLTVNFAYMSDVRDVKKLLTGDKNPVVPLRIPPSGGPASIRLTDEVAVWIMPMRIQDADAFKRPHWL